VGLVWIITPKMTDSQRSHAAKFGSSEFILMEVHADILENVREADYNKLDVS
jgi:hypothetical protein